VGHYRFARQYCGVPSVSGGELTFAEPSAACKANATALTFIVDTEADVATLTATQDGTALPTKRVGAKRYLVDMDPTRGAVLISSG
jgi:hypothetical protein